MSQPTVFISYSRQDEDIKDALLRHLSVLQYSGLLDLWSDDRIVAGSTWEEDINRALTQAKVAILLISANYLTSEFILNTEVPTLLERRQREGVVVFPVIAKACAWEKVDWLRQMQVRPKSGQSVWRQNGRYADEELAAIAMEVGDIFEQAQLNGTASNQKKLLARQPGLKQLWELFLSDGARFIVPYHAREGVPKTRLKVEALTMRAVFNMYRLLVRQFADSSEIISRIRLDFDGVTLSDTNLQELVTSGHPHLIVIGAPGANPLSNYLMAQFKGIPYNNKGVVVKQGYVFRVHGVHYLSEGPFIITDEKLEVFYPEEQVLMQQQGIYDLKPDHLPHPFPRKFPRFAVPRVNDPDCAIIVTGRASLPGENDASRRVVIIAGHSRHSTLFGTTFVATNEEWAQQVIALGDINTETVIGLRPDPVGAPVAPAILAGPREIQKQPPQN